MLFLLFCPFFLFGQNYTIQRIEGHIISFDGKKIFLEDSSVVELPFSEEDNLLVLTRHAEKVDQSKDAALSETGKQRAVRLARILSEAPLFDSVYSSRYQRTINTIRPYCHSKHIHWRFYDPKQPEDFLDRIKFIKKVLICGHSNSIPRLINLLTGSSMEEFREDEYSNLIFIILPKNGPIKIYFFQY